MRNSTSGCARWRAPTNAACWAAWAASPTTPTSSTRRPRSCSGAGTFYISPGMRADVLAGRAGSGCRWAAFRRASWPGLHRRVDRGPRRHAELPLGRRCLPGGHAGQHATALSEAAGCSQMPIEGGVGRPLLFAAEVATPMNVVSMWGNIDPSYYRLLAGQQQGLADRQTFRGEGIHRSPNGWPPAGACVKRCRAPATPAMKHRRPARSH